MGQDAFVKYRTIYLRGLLHVFIFRAVLVTLKQSILNPQNIG